MQGQLKKLGLQGWQRCTPAGVAKDKGIRLKETPGELKVTKTLDNRFSSLDYPSISFPLSFEPGKRSLEIGTITAVGWPRLSKDSLFTKCVSA